MTWLKNKKDKLIKERRDILVRKISLEVDLNKLRPYYGKDRQFKMMESRLVSLKYRYQWLTMIINILGGRSGR